MRLNVGCGRHVLDGWFNVDIQRSPHAKRAPELLSDVRKINLPDACADEVMAIHLWEHFHPWECDALLAEWTRLLKPGGLLVLELPDILKCSRNIVEGLTAGKDVDQMGMWGLYGDPRSSDPYMAHKWGWTPVTLGKFLKARGYVSIKETVPKWHPAGRFQRDMRIEAVKV